MQGNRVLIAAVVTSIIGIAVPAAATAATISKAKGTVSYSAAPTASPAKKKGKKKKKKPAVTRTSSASLPPSSTQTAAATCPKGTHMSGGGYQVTPLFDPVTTSGTRSLTVNSHSSGARSWTARSDGYATPATPGTLTTAVRCERNSLGQLAVTISGSATLNPSTGATQNIVCPPGTHVISGGYDGTGLGAYTFAPASQRILVLQSRRTGPAQWTISSYNNPTSPVAASITVSATCELNGKGRSVSEASKFAPLNVNARTTAQATCGKKAHVVSGGFLVSPATFPGSVPLISIDDSMPVGSRSWRIGIWDFPLGDPPGSALQAVAYCKKN